VNKRRDPNPTFDLFIPLVNDLPLKDQREVMERPFFSLQKRKRLKPIEYRSPDGEAWVKVGLVTVLRRSPISLSHLGFEGERADAAQI